MIWLSGDAMAQQQAGMHAAGYLLLLACVMGAVLLGVWLMCVRLARQLGGRSLWVQIRQYNRLSWLLRVTIPLCFAGAVFFCSWPAVVQSLLRPVLGGFRLESASLLIGTLPAWIAWVAMWIALYPARRAARELSQLDRLEADMPLSLHPTLWQHLVSNTRMQILTMLATILCIASANDVLTLLARALGLGQSQTAELVVGIVSLLGVMLLSPILLVRVLSTQRLPDSPLRDRLEQLCRDHQLRPREILLWKTHGDVANAAMIGVLPHLRYVLVSDLILESMPQQQILGVFAHETGHVVHRHVWWFAACSLTFALAASGPGETLWKWVGPWVNLSEPYASMLLLGATMPLFFAGLGFVSRRFERQADVFAARTMPAYLNEPVLAGVAAGPVAAEAKADFRFVQSSGAQVVCGALERIATINGIPIDAHEWLHGSIGWRMRYLAEIADIPSRSRAFDTSMQRLFRGIVALAVLFALWTLYGVVH